MTDTRIPEALVKIWGKQCKKGDYVFLSFRDPSKSNQESGRWKDVAISYNPSTIKDKVKECIDNNSPDKLDVYYCPLPFTEPKRRKEYVKGSKYLWSDMDEADPNKVEVTPTIYWRSSPGRYQGLWELDRFIKPEQAEELNRNLTYRIGADKGGWDLTQVLRVPYTTNHKYKNKPKVGPLNKIRRNPFHLDDLNEMLASKPEPPKEEPMEELDPIKILAKYKKIIPRAVLSKLTTHNVEVGKRSDVIWWLEHKLREVGLSPPEIYSLIKYSAWNKYKGRSDEDERLKSELIKILDKEAEEPSATPEDFTEAGLGLVVENYSEVMSNLRTFPGWLVEGFWMRRSHGIVAGEPKSFKSVLTLDLGVSVASGKPFLNKFPVLETGPVLIVQNENADWIMKDRLEKIITNKGLVGEAKVKDNSLSVDFPPVLPLYFINQQGFLLNDENHQRVVEKVMKEIKPVLVMFDPLYLMFDGDVNSAKDLNPILNWMLHLKNEYNTGVIAIHHWNKGSGKKGQVARGGQRMLGSTTLHGWVESAWYVGVVGDEGKDEENEEVVKSANKPVNIVIDREFRAGGTRPKIEVNIKLSEVGEPDYKVNVRKHVGKSHLSATDDLKFQVVNVLEAYQGAVSIRKLSEDTGAGRKAIRKILDELSERGSINQTHKGVELLYKPEEFEEKKDEDG